jgi:hypothetical protein
VPRRVSLPGADELFRTTGGASLQSPQPRAQRGGEQQPPAQGEERLRPVPGEEQQDEAEDDPRSAGSEHGADSPEHGGRDLPARRALTADRAGVAGSATAVAPAPPAQLPAQQAAPSQNQKPVPPPITAQPQPQPAGRRKAPRQNRRPSGRERHDEKITVYVSAEELMDLEHARLVLRGEHGLAIDRGRIVREAVAVVLADLESRGDASILVRRLRGR